MLHFAPPALTAPKVRLVNLADPQDIARLSAWMDGREDATAFHRIAWGEAVARATGHDFLALVAEDTTGDLTGYLPLHAVHSPLFGRAMVSAGFAVDGGIIASDGASAQALSQAGWQLAERYSAPTLELRGGWLPENPCWTIKSNAHAGFIADLVPESPDADQKQLEWVPRKQRAEVRKGLANGLVVRTGTSALDRQQHYAVYATSVRNLGTPVFPRALFEAVLDGLGDDADILTVLHGDVPVASVLNLYHRGTVMPFWGGGVWAARGLRANDVMYYALMNHARRRGCVRFDFGRSKVGSGAFSFKKNWGFEPAPLSYAIRNADGQPPRDVNPLSPKYRLQIALWQRLPLPIANRLGPLIANGLG
ncbi:FemAB family XrtA/PEP-CTERM system-associated protein [Blastomonas aquatica]|uniref:Peptidoglycan bridge formation protein FemAB n=1 Tax=Blastomonas aquatica TaxID=1510276 RepID=A0ABQ1JQF7_9SPHN|nr:FemAB family XrtA/PEP-CTERM system-associated protein [Blastomonas aquatica]GGB73005.1 peptidoglycan bridge formation protein FemAB [Blastomonas aquatica]